MDNLFSIMQTLLSSEAFKGILNNDTIQLQQFFAAQALLYKLGFPYDVAYSPGSRRLASSAQLTIYINPTTTLEFTFSFQGGGSIFGGGGFIG